MNQEQALQVIKQVIDAALSTGVFKKLEDTTSIAIAYETLYSAFKAKTLSKSVEKSQELVKE